MSETSIQVVDLPEPWMIILSSHVSQFVVAVIIIGLDLYGVQYVAYNALVCSMVVAVCTIVVCSYFIVSQCWLRRLYSPYITAAYHAWMLLFWIVDLGLVAHLAKLWGGPGCPYGFHIGYICSPSEKRSTVPGQEPSFTTYYEALIAGAVLAAFELVLWLFTTILTFLHSMKKYRLANTPTTRQYPRATSPHLVIIPSQDIEIPMDQIAAIAPWSVPLTLTETERGPIIPDPNELLPSPSSCNGQPSHTLGPLGISSDVPLSVYQNSVPSKVSGPPRDTEQVDWSVRSITNPSAASLPRTDDQIGQDRKVHDA